MFTRRFPRWVSLLVAEVYYPHARFPNAIATASTSPVTAQLSNQSPKLQQHFNQFSIPNHLNQMGPIEDFHNLQQYLHRRGGYRSDELKFDQELAKPRRMRKQIESRVQILSENDKEPDSNRKPDVDDEQCDGYDKIGCYIVRVYYDWFLVPG